jgi:sugar O-acyltransferase (sialic acid O-acetyltransferase NeuD family)
MSSLLVLGAGGHGRVVADAAISMRLWDLIAFADDRGDTLASPLGLAVVGTLADFEQLSRRFDCVALGVGDNRTRLSLYSRCLQANRALPVVVHSSAAVSPHASIGPGSVIFAQAAVNVGAVLGSACIVNTGATVDHDCQLGAGVHVSPGANLAGNVTVGQCSWIGIGACVRQGIGIGQDVTVGAGSVVLADVEAGATVFGVPARVHR